MKEYFKMSDVFDYKVTGKDISGMDSGGLTNGLDLSAHAINSYDELVAEVDSSKKQIELLVSQMQRVHDLCSLTSHQEVMIRNILRFACNGKIYKHEIHAANLDGRVTASRGVDIGGCILGDFNG